MFPAFVSSSDQFARLAIAKPLIDPIKDESMAARATQDYQTMRRTRDEIKEINKLAGIKTIRMFAPFLQIPLGFGTFRLMRRMAELPVPGLDSAGFLWFEDLTVADPTMALPGAIAATLWLTLKVSVHPVLLSFADEDASMEVKVALMRTQHRRKR